MDETNNQGRSLLHTCASAISMRSLSASMVWRSEMAWIHLCT